MSSPSDTIRVLHVDDDPDFVALSATLVEREDDHIDVETATSVREGLERIAAAEFDCVVSDYDMPGQDGIEFLGAVREEYSALPFILYTGKGSEEVAADAISAGATDYLQKETGNAQYAVLANRITNAVEQYWSSQRAAELDRIRTLTKEINQELVRAESPEEVRARVCEILSESEPYLFAWIGEVDPETNRVEPQTASGGAQEYLDEIDITTDATPTGQGPGGTAIREGEIAVSKNVAEDPNFEPWRTDAVEHGFHAAAAVPLEYLDTLYGELVVYAEHPNAFDANERSLLTELSRDIAHALHSFDVRASLREERDFIEQALDSLNDAFYVVNTDGTFRRWNDELVAASGYSEAELAEMQAIDLLPAEEHARTCIEIQEALTSGESTFEVDLLTADGERLPYELAGSPLTDTDGNLLGLIGIGRDLSERKQREYQLKRLVDNLPGMIYRCENQRGWPMEDLRGEVEELLGYEPSEVENGADIFGREIIHPDDQEEVWNSIQEAVDAHDPFEVTYRIRTKDGAVKWVWDRGQAVYSDDGEIEVLEGFITDVSKQESQKQVIDTLHETAQSVMRANTTQQAAEIAVNTLHDVLDMPASAVHLHDEEAGGGKLIPVAWTDVTEELVDQPPVFVVGEGLAGKAFEAGEPVFYDDVSSAPDRFNPDTPIQSEMIFPLGNHGVVLTGSTEPDAFDDVDISLAETVAAHTTIALDRIEREQELQAQNERLEEFTSIVSHDLRNPLNVAEGYIDLYKEDPDSEHLEAVARAHGRMGALLDDLLELAREGADVSDLEPVQLAALCRDCWENVDTAEATLVVDSERTVQADRSRLAQLLENLVRNAVEHGGDDVTTTVGEIDGGFYVADDGEGIPADEREHVFEYGYSSQNEGTGFGLPIVQEIVKGHGWEIGVTESEAGGARFEITGLEPSAEESR